jgi:hypothetical protein
VKNLSEGIAILATTAIVVVGLILWRRCVVSPPIASVMRSRSVEVEWCPPRSWRNPGRWTDIRDDRPLVMQTEWNYFPPLPSMPPPKMIDDVSYTDSLKAFEDRLQGHLAGEIENNLPRLEQYLWTYYGRDPRPATPTPVVRTVAILYFKEESIVHRKMVEVPTKMLLQRHHTSGLAFTADPQGDVVVFADRDDDNSEWIDFVHQCVRADVQENRSIFAGDICPFAVL